MNASFPMPTPIARSLLIVLSLAIALTACGGKKPPASPTAPAGGKTKATQKPYTVMG
jgi:predicted small lipoprotein YifL